MNINSIIEKLYKLRETHDRNSEEYDAIDRAISALEDYSIIRASKEEI